ncbi:hypothetical protein Tco_0595474 [Tanacetum coccineum]
MAIHLDEEFYPHFLTTISERRWFLSHGLKLVLLKCLQSSEYLQALRQAISCAVNKGIQAGLNAGIDHGQAGRDLSVVEAYDPSTEAKYIDAMNALGVVGFSLLSELKDDVVIKETSISSSFHVVQSRVQRFRGEVKEKRLSLADVMTPLVEPLSSRSLIGKASTSATLATTESITTLTTALASSDVIPPLATSNDQALVTEPNNKDPPVMTFEREELVTSPE